MHVNIRTSSHNLSYNCIEGGGQSGWWIKKGGCCWTIGLADCLSSSGQLRVSVTGPLKTPLPSPPSVPLSHYSDRPASVPVLSEGLGWWGWECRAVMAFVPFIKSVASLSSHDQQSCSRMTFSIGLLTSNNNMWRDKSFTNSGDSNKVFVLKPDTRQLHQSVKFNAFQEAFCNKVL